MSQFAKINFPLLSIAKKVLGNLIVPQKFAVPKSSHWPADFEGYKLGIHVNNIRQNIKKRKVSKIDVDKLLEMGFIPDIRKYQTERTLLGFKEFKRIHNHCDLTYTYVIPRTKEWPEEVQGMKLGLVLANIRNRNILENIHKKLTKLGFDLGPQNNGVDFQRTYDALVAYKSIHCNLEVPDKFAVPENDSRFPQNTWGVKLGNNLKNIRYRDAWSEHRERLEALGVSYEVKSLLGFEVIFSALQSYKALHGDVKVPQKFIVPENDQNYPENTWGMKLGITLHNIRIKSCFKEHREQLQALGVNFTKR